MMTETNHYYNHTCAKLRTTFTFDRSQHLDERSMLVYWYTSPKIHQQFHVFKIYLQDLKNQHPST